MSQYSLSHLSDGTLLRDLTELVAKDRATTAALLAHLAEVDDRKLYVPAAYPSMYAWCVSELHLCEQAAFKRIRAARAGRRFPVIFEAVADGRLNLTTVVALAPYLTEETADELVAAATHKTTPEVGQLLAQRFPRPDLPTMIQTLTPEPSPLQLSSRTVEELAARPVELSAPGRINPPLPRPRLTPLAPERFALQVTIGQSTHDKLRYAQELLSHQVSSGDVAEVLDRALDALIRRLEQRKFAATSRPRRGRHSSKAASRHIPAEVQRAVWQRDQGRCTFVSAAGHRCKARRRLEFDHIDPVARGGQATVGRIRLRCQAHNQFEAERMFGAGFMNEKRGEARRAAQARKQIAQAKSRPCTIEHEAWAQAGAAQTVIGATHAGSLSPIASDSRALVDANEQTDIVAGLRSLGFRADEARRAAEYSATLQDATLEQRMRAALKMFGRRAALRVDGQLSPRSPRDETHVPAC